MPRIAAAPMNGYRITLHADPHSATVVRFEFTHPLASGNGSINIVRAQRQGAVKRDCIVMDELHYNDVREGDSILDGLAEQIDILLHKIYKQERNPCGEIPLAPHTKVINKMHAQEAYANEQGESINSILGDIERVIRQHHDIPGKEIIGKIRVSPLTKTQKDVLTDVYGYVVRPILEDVPNKAFFPPVLKNQHVADEIIWHEE